MLKTQMLFFLLLLGYFVLAKAKETPSFNLRKENNSQLQDNQQNRTVNTNTGEYSQKQLTSGWMRFNGSLKAVELDHSARHIWGVNRYDDIWRVTNKNSQSWTQVSGKLRTIALSGDGRSVWGTNSQNEIYRTSLTHSSGGDGWKRIGGFLEQLDVTFDEAQVWGVRSGGVYYSERGSGWETWIRLHNTYEAMRYIAISGNGRVIVALNGNGKVFLRNGNNWVWMTGSPYNLKQMSIDHNGKNIWAVDKSDNVYFYSGNWILIGGQKLKYVSVSGDGREAWGCDAGDNIYVRRVGEGESTTWQLV